MRGIVRRIAPDTNCFLLYLIPIVLIMFLHFDFNYLVFGTIAFNMMLCALYFCLCISTDKWRMIAEIIITPLLYGLAGSVACLFALSVVVLSSLIKLPGFTGRYFLLFSLFFAGSAVSISRCWGNIVLLPCGCLLSYCIGTENCHLLFMDFVTSDPDCRFSVEEKEERYQ